MKPLGRNEFREVHDVDGISWVHIDGRPTGLARGDVVVWRERPCGCCLEPVRVEQRVVN
jgi:hypothetical protein